MKTTMFTGLFLSSLFACQQEENPYKDSLKPDTSKLRSQPQSDVSSDEKKAEGSPVVEEADVKEAEEGSIEESKISSTERICQDTALQNKFPEELSIICLDGKATNEFASLLATPYDGTNQSNFRLAKSEDVNGISEMIAITSLKVNQPISEVFNRRAQMNTNTVSAGNATLTFTQQSEIAAQGNGHLGGFEVAIELVVRVAIVTVRQPGVQVRELFDLAGDMSVIADAAYLKANDPVNTPGTVSNNLAFWIADGEQTLMVVLTRQKADNRGQHNQAEAAFSGIGPAMNDSMLTLFNQ